jgi:hypothetical protein
MKNVSNTTQKPKTADYVGGFINREVYQSLTTQFSENFPSEVSSVFISKEVILQVLQSSESVSGIRFMYGLTDAENPKSRQLILVPCNMTSIDKTIPNSIILKDGYLTHEGESVTLNKTWMLFNNHVNRMATLLPNQRRKDLIRGCFFGINSLTALLQDENCIGINYYLGFNASHNILTERHQAVLEPLDFSMDSYGIFMDFTAPCPNTCLDDDPFGTFCIDSTSVLLNSTENELDIHRNYRDNFLLKTEDGGAIFEMYYHVTPTLTESINFKPDNINIYNQLYQNSISKCTELINQEKYQDAKVVFIETMDELMEKFLF